jgi:hypothetical protein
MISQLDARNISSNLSINVHADALWLDTSNGIVYVEWRTQDVVAIALDGSHLRVLFFGSMEYQPDPVQSFTHGPGAGSFNHSMVSSFDMHSGLLQSTQAVPATHTPHSANEATICGIATWQDPMLFIANGSTGSSISMHVALPALAVFGALCLVTVAIFVIRSRRT